VEKRTAQQPAPLPERKPLGASGQTVSSQNRRRRRIDEPCAIAGGSDFPNTIAMATRGARGRDIPFKKGRWYDPYHQNWLKGDYPIIGNKCFMILSAVSYTSVDLSRTPKPSGVQQRSTGKRRIFGKPEALSLNQIFQFTFEMFHGDSTYKPRDWAIKISPTFSLPNYLKRARKRRVNIDVRRGTNRTDTQVSLEEAFAEVKFADVNQNFDFIRRASASSHSFRIFGASFIQITTWARGLREF